MVPLALGLVHYLASLVGDSHLLRAHLVLGEVFHLDGVETSQSAMHGDEREVHAFDLQAFHQLAAEVQTRCWCRDGALVFGIDGLEVLYIILCDGALVYDVTGQWR